MKAEETLSNDHREIDELLASIFGAIEMDSPDKLNGQIDQLWARLAVHIRAEHRYLFPVLIEAARKNAPTSELAQELETVIDSLRQDHDHFVKVLAGLVAGTREKRNIRSEDLELQLRELAERLASHNKIEEAKVYPLVEKLLPSPTAFGLQEQIRREIENLPPRFADLRQDRNFNAN